MKTETLIALAAVAFLFMMQDKGAKEATKSALSDLQKAAIEAAVAVAIKKIVEELASAKIQLEELRRQVQQAHGEATSKHGVAGDDTW